MSSEIKVFKVDKVGYDAGNFTYTDITEDVIKQAQMRADDANFAAQAAGKEGVGGENIFNRGAKPVGHLPMANKRHPKTGVLFDNEGFPYTLISLLKDFQLSICMVCKRVFE